MNPNALPKIKAKDLPWHQRRGQQDHQRQSAVPPRSVGTALCRFVSQEITFHVSSLARPITSSSSLACCLGDLAPSCFPFLLKRSSVILTSSLFWDGGSAGVSQGGRRVFCQVFFYFIFKQMALFWHVRAFSFFSFLNISSHLKSATFIFKSKNNRNRNRKEIDPKLTAYLCLVVPQVNTSAQK